MDTFLPTPGDSIRPTWTRARVQPPETPRARGGAPADPIAAAQDCPVDPQTLDSLRALATDHTPDLLLQLVELFLDDAQQSITAMWTAVAEADAPQLRQLAHRLKGSSASLGAFALSHFCEELERLARAGATGAACPQIAQVRDEYARVAQALDLERHRPLAFS